MNNLTKKLIAPVIAAALALVGCGDGHDHGHDHDKNSKDDHGHKHEKEDGNDDKAEHKLGEITIAGTVLDVALDADPAPGKTLHAHLDLKSGPTPSAIRVWIGKESGEGVAKGKASGSDGHYHADALCPTELSETDALWIEVESADGKRTTKSMSLEHDHE